MFDERSFIARYAWRVNINFFKIWSYNKHQEHLADRCSSRMRRGKKCVCRRGRDSLSPLQRARRANLRAINVFLLNIIWSIDITCNLRVTACRTVCNSRRGFRLRSLDFSRTLNTLDIPMRRADYTYVFMYVSRFSRGLRQHCDEMKFSSTCFSRFARYLISHSADILRARHLRIRNELHFTLIEMSFSVSLLHLPQLDTYIWNTFNIKHRLILVSNYTSFYEKIK